MAIPGSGAAAALGARAGMAGSALSAAGTLLLRGVRAALAGGGAEGRRARLAGLLGAAENQRLVFALLRATAPNLVLSRRLVTAYDNAGTAIVTRRADVTEVLEREADFAVVYEPKMRAITAGENFFLGMQDGPAYRRDVGNMRLAVRREDVPAVVLPFAGAQADAIVAAAPGRLDVPAELTQPVLARLVGAYFGTPGPSERELVAWTTILFWYLFVDLAGKETVSRPALDAAAAFRAHLDAAIAARKAAPTETDDVLNRCLAMQAAGRPGMDDLAIRNNLVGLLIGLVPTLSKAAVKALDGLLHRPEALATVHRAAREGDDALLAACVFEALRFDPVNPVIYRRAVRETVIARGTPRERRIPKDTMVLAANLSAMFDPAAVEDPDSFRTDRPWDIYMLWGHGLHTCFGAHINRAIIPRILKPLLLRPGLRRAAGPAGTVDGGGTPFPVHFTVEFDRG